MQSVQVVEPGRLEVVERDVPDGPGALVKIERVGICGTDVKVFTGKIPAPYPLTMGHEAVGIIEEPGALGLFAPGDRVLIDPAVACGHCDLCRAGRVHICRNGGLLGRDAHGVFADYARVPEERLLAVPDSIEAEATGLLQVLGTTIHAQRAVSIFPGDTVSIIGLGVSGLLMVQLLKARGATVIGITRSQWKLDLAAELGADAVAQPDAARDLVHEMTDGRGVDIGLEAAGTEGTLAETIELTRTGGEILVFGTLTGGSNGLPYYQFYHKELTIHNPRAAQPTDYERGILLAANGTLELGPIVTHRFGLAEAGDAFDAVQDSSSLKVLMTP